MSTEVKARPRTVQLSAGFGSAFHGQSRSQRGGQGGHIAIELQRKRGKLYFYIGLVLQIADRTLCNAVPIKNTKLVKAYSFKVKMHRPTGKYHFRPRLRPGPCWEAHDARPDPQSTAWEWTGRRTPLSIPLLLQPSGGSPLFEVGYRPPYVGLNRPRW